MNKEDNYNTVGHTFDSDSPISQYPQDGQVLNKVLVTVLWLKFAGTIVALFGLFYDVFLHKGIYAHGVSAFQGIINIFLTLLVLLGLYLFLKVNRYGFYLIAIVLVSTALVSFLSVIELNTNEFADQILRSRLFYAGILNLVQLIVLMLLMLLKRYGKNAYQVLWKNR